MRAIGMEVKRDWRYVALIALLLLALGHAWSGHDLTSGHGHKDLGSVSYSTDSHRHDAQAHILTVALVVELVEISLRPPSEIVEVVDNEAADCRDPVPIVSRHVPRPPPIFSFSLA